jgi:hypothetical protein
VKVSCDGYCMESFRRLPEWLEENSSNAQSGRTFRGPRSETRISKIRIHDHDPLDNFQSYRLKKIVFISENRFWIWKTWGKINTKSGNETKWNVRKISFILLMFSNRYGRIIHSYVDWYGPSRHSRIVTWVLECTMSINTNFRETRFEVMESVAVWTTYNKTHSEILHL